MQNLYQVPLPFILGVFQPFLYQELKIFVPKCIYWGIALVVVYDSPFIVVSMVFIYFRKKRLRLNFVNEFALNNLLNILGLSEEFTM